MNEPTIDVGDVALHAPSGETWLVGAVVDDRLYWCGWPFGGNAALSDCALKRKATPEQRDRLLRELADGDGGERPRVLARMRLEAAR